MRALAPLFILAAALFGGAAQAAELVMFDQRACSWCARWEAEIGVAYPKTEESGRAPLRRVDIARQGEAGMTLTRRVNFTPTFVLVHEGAEIGRIEGYPGPDFFWPMLADLLDRLPEPVVRLN